MAHAVMVNPRFTFGGTDMASSVTELELTLNTDQVSDLAGGDTVETFLVGLRKFGGTVAGFQDFAVGVVDSVIYTAWAARSTVAITLGPDAGSKTTSNPSYEYTAFVGEYKPISGRMGEAFRFSLTIPPTTDLSRATS